ncbi:MAG: DsbA family protein, partial [Xanthomonadales bacterium]|nr:DsbA family protein [Xanthomonadales bacterium]
MPVYSATIYYVHDPMCSWCWAYRPNMLLLRKNLAAEVHWQNLLGGLAPDSDQPMPEQTRLMVQSHWRQIESTLGTEFNFDFWTKNQPRRDTYKACRAVIAASNQHAEERMIESIQTAYYLRALNPSDPLILASLADELGLDRALFIKDLGSAQTETELARQLQLRDRLRVRSFPSLVLEYQSRIIPIRHDYQDYR